MQEAGLCMVLLSAQADSFFALAEAGQDLEKQLKHTGVLQVQHILVYQLGSWLNPNPVLRRVLHKA